MKKTKIEARLLSVAAYMRGNAYAVKGNVAEVQSSFPEELVLGHGRTYRALSLFVEGYQVIRKFQLPDSIVFLPYTCAVLTQRFFILFF